MATSGTLHIVREGVEDAAQVFTKCVTSSSIFISSVSHLFIIVFIYVLHFLLYFLTYHNFEIIML